MATDQNFVVPTATTLRSLSLHDPGPVTVWILATSVSDTSKSAMEASLVGKGVLLEWIDMQDVQLGDTTKSTLGPATYFRLAIGELLPPDIDRVLYMDTDMLVMESLEGLWDLPDGDEVAWAVRSVHYPSMCTYGAMDNWDALGLDPRAPYFNAGLMMIDLKLWRSLDIGRLALEHLASPLANGALADQEALNVVLAGRWGELHPRWNQQTPLLEENRGVQMLYSDEVITEARSGPAIVHFLSRPKPWHKDCTHPFRDKWRAIASETAFAPVKLEKTSAVAHAKWRIRRAASALVKGR